jgi:hypothetical protein
MITIELMFKMYIAITSQNYRKSFLLEWQTKVVYLGSLNQNVRNLKLEILITLISNFL